MNHKNKYLITLIVSMWMSVITTLEGFRPMFNQQPLNNDFGHGESTIGKKWAILVAGSSEYVNYRHQADICHAYQILKKGGLEDENIIVFMYDDIAYNSENPRPGVIINHPNGSDVYHGVPKDYTRYNATGENFFGVLRGNTSAVKGGSGKVLKSGPNDIVFIYYADHGSAGLIGMPDDTVIYGIDIVNTLKDLYAAKSYKKMMIYVEACESGSLFEGLLPNDINIYVTTASNATEDSSAYYCPPPSPPLEEDLEYTTCLGDLYSISWMEDSDKHDMNEETLKEQYENVRRRTLAADLDKNASSHVMQYGDIKMDQDFLFTYFGENHTNFSNDNNAPNNPTRLVSQRDAHLLHLMHKLKNAQDGSQDKLKAQKELDIERAHREHVDNNVHLIGDILFGEKKSSTMMFHVRPPGQPLVDDWDCFKTLIKTYENHCGILSTYGRKYTRVFANMCNVGISEMQLVEASLRACPKKNHTS